MLTGRTFKKLCIKAEYQEGGSTIGCVKMEETMMEFLQDRDAVK
jgi:hypothetical protein